MTMKGTKPHLEIFCSVAITECPIKEEFLFCQPVKKSTVKEHYGVFNQQKQRAE